MKVVYDSRGGTTKNTAKEVSKKLGLDCLDIKRINKIEDEYILFTYTDGKGEVAVDTEPFLFINNSKCKGVVVNGSKDFLIVNTYCMAGEIIREEYGIPIIKKLDKGGSKSDISLIVKYLSKKYNLKIKEDVESAQSIVGGLIQMKRI